MVESATAARLVVHFPRSGQRLEFATASHPFVPLVHPADADPAQWFELQADAAPRRLARLDVDPFDAFTNRLAGFELLERREAKGLGSFLGGRIEIFPHQLHVAERAAAGDPVRWLLADEVGLGKTVEACLIVNHLLRTKRADRVLVVAPRSLVVQWLGELYRKFHQVFALIDDERRRDVVKEIGREINPFEAFTRSVVALEDLVEKPDVQRRAREAELDLLVVDEAHRLRRARGSPGSPAYRAMAPLAQRAKHVLLLTATPLEADAHGFFRLLELLRPDAYSSEEAFDESLRAKRPLLPCTSTTRRVDIGGLPPRVAFPVELPPDLARLERERAVRAAEADNAVQVAARVSALERFVQDPESPQDPRLQWLAREAKQWAKRGEKALVFVHRREALQLVKSELEFHTSRRVAVFHEDLSPEARDLEVARFADPEGPALLVSTESGGEGRNFQFARRLVLFDLPWEPALVEQRIGRLDRIDRRRPVEIVYFRPAEGIGAEVARLVEHLGVFEEPLGALDRELGGISAAIRTVAADPNASLDAEALARDARAALERVHESAFHQLHPERWRPELASDILARIPEDLESRTRAVVLEACRQYGFMMEPKGGSARWYLEFGHEASIETMHGVAPGQRWLGTFDREEACRHETLDFFAAGHPIVEAVLAEIADGTRGQVTLLEIEGVSDPGDTEAERAGIVVATREGPRLRFRGWDLDGRERSVWAQRVARGGSGVRPAPPGTWNVARWSERVLALWSGIEEKGNIVSIAGIRVTPHRTRRDQAP